MVTIEIQRVDVGARRLIVERTTPGEAFEVREVEYPNRVVEGDVAERAIARAFPVERPDRWWDK